MREPVECAGAHREGILFIGDKGTIMAGFSGRNPQLFANGKRGPLRREEASREDTSRRSSSRYRAWLQACEGGEPSPGSFANAGAITDAVNLGAVALRAGKKVLSDSENMNITNDKGANEYLHREYRSGWEL